MYTQAMTARAPKNEISAITCAPAGPATARAAAAIRRGRGTPWPCSWQRRPPSRRQSGARRPGGDGGELVGDHAPPHRDARDGERTVARMPPADPAVAEGAVPESVQDLFEPRRLPAARQRGAAHRGPEPVLEDGLRLAELVAEPGRIQPMQEGMGQGVTADLHSRRGHLPQLRPAHVSGRARPASGPRRRSRACPARAAPGRPRCSRSGSRRRRSGRRTDRPAPAGSVRRPRSAARLRVRRHQVCPELGRRQRIRAVCRGDVGEVFVAHDVVQTEDCRPPPHT